MMEFVNGKDDIPYMKWKIKNMYQTTNRVQPAYDMLIQYRVYIYI